MHWTYYIMSIANQSLKNNKPFIFITIFCVLFSITYNWENIIFINLYSSQNGHQLKKTAIKLLLLNQFLFSRKTLAHYKGYIALSNKYMEIMKAIFLSDSSQSYDGSSHPQNPTDEKYCPLRISCLWMFNVHNHCNTSIISLLVASTAMFLY